MPIIGQTQNISVCHLINICLLLQVSKSSELLKKLQETLAQCHYDLDETRKRAEEDVRLYIFVISKTLFLLFLCPGKPTLLAKNVLNILLNRV